MPNPDSPQPKNQGLTALVAGGASFLGSHLCETLLTQNIQVIAVDNLSRAGQEKIKHLLTNPHFSLLDYDLNTTPIRIEEKKIDYVFHLASVEEKESSEDLSLETLLVNSLGTKHLLDLARVHKAKFLLVSSADIYSGALSSSSLNYYFGRSLKDEKILTHLEAKRYAEALTFEYFKKYSLDARICRIQDVYGPRLNLASGETLNRLVKEGLETNKVTLEGDGLKVLHPTYVSDVVYGLVKAILQENTKGKIFNLISPHKITVLALVNEFKKAFGKKLDLVFTKGEGNLDFPYHTLDLETTLNTLNWRPRVTLIEGLIATYASFGKERLPLSSLTTLTPQPTKTSFKMPTFFRFTWPAKLTTKNYFSRSTLRFTIFLASLTLLLLGVLYPALSFFLSVNSSTDYLNQSLKEIESAQFEKASTLAQKASLGFVRASRDLNNLTWLATMVGSRDKIALWERTIFAFGNLAKAVTLTTLALGPMEELLVNFKNPQPTFATSFEQKLTNQASNLSLAFDKLAGAEATFVELGAKGQKSFLDKEKAELQKSLSLNKERLASLRELYSLLPDLLGFKTSKNYLLLEVEDQTSRSSGGVLKNYLVITLDKGVVKKQVSGEVATLNSQATIKTALPSELKDTLKTDSLVLSESLWEIDLGEGSLALRRFFAATGQPLAGIGVITSAQLSRIMEGNSLTLTTLVEGLKTLNYQDWQSLLTHLKVGLEGKKVAFLGVEEPLKSVLDDKKWSGKVQNEKLLAQKALLKEQSSIPQDVIPDYLLVVTDSFTPNTKIEPTVEYLLEVGTLGLMEGTVTLHYVNTSSREVGGYSRVLVPLGSVLETKEVGEKPVLVEQKSNKTQFGFPLKVKAGEEKQVILKYQIPLQVKDNQQTAYSLLVQKPLGEQALKYQISLLFPPNIQITPNDNLAFSNQKAVTSGETHQDLLIILKAKKT